MVSNLTEIAATRKSVDKKIDELCTKDKISSIALQREFGISYYMAIDIMMVFTDAGIVKETDKILHYQIINQAAFKEHLSMIITFLKSNSLTANWQEVIQKLNS